MGWETPSYDEVVVQDKEKGFKPIPAGNYTFTLLPSSNFDETKQRLNIAVALAEGEFRGRRIFPTLPPAKSVSDWPNQILKRIALATGVEFLPGEQAADYLNRVAVNGNSRFTGNLYQRAYKKKDGSDGMSEELQLSSIGVAA